MEENDRYIEGIYNYCDRWCERCKYTDRCYSFQMDVEDGIDPLNPDVSDEEVWEQVGKRLSQALELLRQHAVEMGLDFDNLPEVVEEPPSELAARLEAQSKKLHKEYVKRTQAFFENNTDYFKEKTQESADWVEMGIADDEETGNKWKLVDDQTKVIQWYTFFVGVKMRRAIGGLDEMHGEQWSSPEQSDANRTARITMLAIERSMAAWQVMLGTFTEKEDEIIQLLALLAKFRRMVETTFPRWAEAGPEVVW